MEIVDLQKAIAADRIRVTDHADEEARSDGLLLDEILASVSRGEIIEEYTPDEPYPSCLVFGTTPEGAPVHSVWAYNDRDHWEVLITTYRPDPGRWIDWKERRT